MRRYLMSLAMAAGAVTGIAVMKGTAEEKKAEKAISAQGQAMVALSLGYELAEFGRATQNVEALVLAAKMIAGADALEPGKGTTKPDAKTAETMKNAPKVEDKITPGSLIEEAGKLADSDSEKTFVSAARKELAERKRGEIDGPQTNYGNLAPGGSATWNSTFVQGQLAVISVGGTGGTPVGAPSPYGRPRPGGYQMTGPGGGGGSSFHVTVYNDVGQLVTSGSGPFVNLRWYPTYTKTFSIIITDMSGNGGPYRLTNN